MSDEQRIEQIKARCEQATAGPWNILHARNATCWHVSSPGGKFETGCIGFDGNSQATAEFVASARDDIPWLLEQLEASQQQVTELQAEVERLAKQYKKLYETFGLQNWEYKNSAGNIKTLEGEQP